MKHVIIFPYHCYQEVKDYSELACLWKSLTHTNLEYEFLLSARYDAEPNKFLEKQFAKIAPVRSFRCKTKGRGIKKPSLFHSIEGPTAMFWDTFEFISENYPDDGGFCLWFESDMIPLTPHWLDRLHAEWNTGKFLIMGKLISEEWITQNLPNWKQNSLTHINGGACYAKNFYKYLPNKLFNSKRSWDVEIFPFLQLHYMNHCKATDLIDFRYHQTTFTELPSNNSFILHGIKDSSAKKHICKKYNLKYPFLPLRERIQLALNI